MSNNSSFEVPKVSLENVQVRKRPQAAGTSIEGLHANGTTSNTQKKRKLPCSEEEDIELIATVKKGEVKGESNTTHRAQVFTHFSLFVYIFSPFFTCAGSHNNII